MLRPNWTLLLAAGFQIHYLSYLHGKSIRFIFFDVSGVLTVLLSFLTTYLVLSLIFSIFHKSRWSKFIGTALFFALQFGLFRYQAQRGFLFDPQVVFTNWKLLFYKESAQVIGGGLGIKFFRPMAILFVVMLGLEWKKRRITSSRFVAQKRWSGALVALLSLGLLSGAQNHSYDPLFQFFISAVRPTQVFDGEHPIVKKYGNQSPFVKSIESARAYEQPPNVIIVFIESFNRNFVDRKDSESGKEFTPYFNALKKKGIYLPHYYGTSIQTGRGMYGAFCSGLPSYKGSEFIGYKNNRFRCLPKILQDQGYQTHFFQAFKDTNFGNKKGFLSANGFDFVESVVQHEESGDEAFHWGWGLQDDIYYKRFFSYMDKQLEANPKPFFASLITVSSHMLFRFLPEPLKKIYPNYNGSSIPKHYGNTIHAVDGFLKTFMEELKKRPYGDNTIVIITGDHSFPIEEHGYHHNEVGAFNENFKTPFLLLWESQLKPQVKSQFNFSHLDILPTVVDLTGTSAKTHIAGQSILDVTDKNRPIYLAQPYQGVSLAVVRERYKYIRDFRYRRESIYDLEADPGESNNIFGTESLGKVVEQFREDLGWFYLNQKLLDSDNLLQVGPAETTQQ